MDRQGLSDWSLGQCVWSRSPACLHATQPTLACLARWIDKVLVIGHWGSVCGVACLHATQPTLACLAPERSIDKVLVIGHWGSVEWHVTLYLSLSLSLSFSDRQVSGHGTCMNLSQPLPTQIHHPLYIEKIKQRDGLCQSKTASLLGYYPRLPVDMWCKVLVIVVGSAL